MDKVKVINPCGTCRWGIGGLSDDPKVLECHGNVPQVIMVPMVNSISQQATASFHSVYPTVQTDNAGCSLHELTP